MKKLFLIIACIFNILLSIPVLAQEDPGVDPEVVPAAPIDDYVWVLALIGLAFVFLKMRNYVKQKSLSIK